MSENTSRKTFALSAAGIAAFLVGAFALLTGGQRAQTLGLTAHGDMVVATDGGAADVVIATRLPTGSAGYILRSISGTPTWRELSSSGTLASRPACAAGREGQEHWATDGATGLQRTRCVHQGAGTYAWTYVAYDVTAAGSAIARTDTSSAPDGGVLTIANGSPTWAAPYATTGVDTSRPAASTSLIGQVYTATDTGGSYRCESDGAGGARWRNVASGELDAVALHCTSSARQHISEATHAPVQAGTIVVFFGTVSTPGSVAAMLGNFNSGGWQLEMGSAAGDRGLLSLYRGGLSITRQELTGATVTGSLNTLHAVAIAVTNASIKWSFDGGAVVTGSATTGTATGTAAWWVCGGAVTQLYQAVRVLGEEASDADLVVLSDATARAAHRIPAVSSAPTILIDWHASRIPSGSLGSTIAGSQADRLYSATGTRLVTL